MENPKQKAEKLIKHFLPYVDWNDLQEDCTNREWAIRNAKKCALICVDENVKMLKIILDQSTNIYQSLNTPKKLCIDLLNPLLKFWEQVKIEIQNYND